MRVSASAPVVQCSSVPLNELCAICEAAPAVRLLGTVAHCEECAESFLAPIREKVRAKYGEVKVTGRTDYGGWWLKCICGASWVGDQSDPCPWCSERYARVVEDERRNLLHPHWLERSAGNETYDSLSPIDQEVWDKTRGQARGAHSYELWERRLARAVSAGLINLADAQKAIARYGARGSL